MLAISSGPRDAELKLLGVLLGHECFLQNVSIEALGDDALEPIDLTRTSSLLNGILPHAKDPDEVPEFKRAHLISTLITARLFAWCAAHPDWCAGEAQRFLEMATLEAEALLGLAPGEEG
jgi:hypothetical protein